LPDFQDASVEAYVRHLVNSYARFTGKVLADQVDAVSLYHAPFIVVSHGVQPDPVFCYANLAAQKLWGMDWQAFTQLPSRLSAEPDAQQERSRLLALAEKQGYVDRYEGVRITVDKRRFRIRNCLLWNVVNEQNERIGQAASFSQVEWL
jgi:hypothetical protein